MNATYPPAFENPQGQKLVEVERVRKKDVLGQIT
jgi:hypothetical protein